MVQKKSEWIKRAKFFAIILGISAIGTGFFVIGFSYLYSTPLGLGACGLCYSLNPEVAYCENYTPINIGEINLTRIDLNHTLNLNES